MTALEIPSIDSADISTWPEDAPIIAVDTKLAETGKHIDFDMAGYYRWLKDEIGVEHPSEAVRVIELVRKGGIKKDYRAAGYANPKTKTASVVVKEKDKKTTQNLFHETGHLIDYSTGEVDPFDPKAREKMIKRALILMVGSRLAVLASGIALAKTGIAGSAGELSGIGISTASLYGLVNPFGRAAGRLSGFASYKLDSSERRARKFTKDNQGLHNLVNTKPR